jgi:hypothetical protein
MAGKIACHTAENIPGSKPLARNTKALCIACRNGFPSLFESVCGTHSFDIPSICYHIIVAMRLWLKKMKNILFSREYFVKSNCITCIKTDKRWKRNFKT